MEDPRPSVSGVPTSASCDARHLPPLDPEPSWPDQRPTPAEIPGQLALDIDGGAR